MVVLFFFVAILFISAAAEMFVDGIFLRKKKIMCVGFVPLDAL